MALMVVTLCSLVGECSHVTHQNEVLLQKPTTAQQIKKFPENILFKYLHTLQNLKVHYCVLKSLSQIPVHTQMNTTNTLPSISL